MAEQAKIPAKLALTIVTRDRKVVDLEVDEVVLPGAEGALGILPGHTPLLAMLRVGELSYRQGAKTHHLVLAQGFAEVLPDRVTVLADSATLPDEIDAQKAELERTEAERELATLATDDIEYGMAQARLDESLAKINISQRGHE